MTLMTHTTRTDPMNQRIARRPIGRKTIVPLAWLVLLQAGAALAAGGEQTREEVVKEMIWQGLNLVLLLGVLFWFGRKPIAEYFASRRSGIQSELRQAADLLTEAEARNAEFQRRLVHLSSEIEDIQEVAKRRAEDETEHILAEARATAERIRRDARAAADQEMRRARKRLREEAADLALEIAAGKLKAQVADADRDRLIDEFILRVEPGSEGVRR